jgi:hypothetical protein
MRGGASVKPKEMLAYIVLHCTGGCIVLLLKPDIRKHSVR